MPALKEASNDTSKQLHADAKEFVPSSVRDLLSYLVGRSYFLLMLCAIFVSPFQATLKATAAAWKPTNEAPKSVTATSSKSSPSSNAGKNSAASAKPAVAKPSQTANAPPAKNGGNIGKTAAAKPSAIESIKHAPQAPPAKTDEHSSKQAFEVNSAADAVRQAPKAPAPSAWGSKTSEAIKMAGPIRPQQKLEAQKQHQPHVPTEAAKMAGPNGTNNRPEARRQHQPNSGRGGRDGGRRGGDSFEKKS